MSSMSIEVISMPVADQDRSKAFYQDKLGFHLLVDNPFGDGQRWIQLAPEEGSEATITLVDWFDDMKPGSLRGLILKTPDIDVTRAALAEKGVSVGNVFDTPWGKFADFKDPDGNGWSLHEG